MIVVIKEGEGEYESYQEIITSVYSIKTKKNFTEEQLNLEFSKYVWGKLIKHNIVIEHVGTHIKVIVNGKTYENGPPKKISNLIAKEFKTTSFEEWLINTYKPKKMEFVEHFTYRG